MVHLNIGPSDISLGLLIPTTIRAGFDVCVVCKPGETGALEFDVYGSDLTKKPTSHEVKWFEGPDRVEDLPGDVRERIGEGEPLLVTTSLREHIKDRLPFIEELLLHARPATAEAIFLACENEPDPAYERVIDVCSETGVHFLRTVVNRICVALPSHDDRRRVSAHTLGEWLVERPPRPLPMLEALERVPEVELVDDFDARYDRKLWMVNGAHQALALMALRGRDEFQLDTDAGEERDDLRQAMEDPQITARISHLHAAMHEALKVKHPHLSDNLDYCTEYLVAYSEHPDSVSRILKSLRRADLTPFLISLQRRLMPPAPICHKRECSIDAFLYVIDVFLELVYNIDTFADRADVRAGAVTLDADEDERAIEYFEGLLIPWAGEKAIKKNTELFSTFLGDHRMAMEQMPDPLP